MEIQHTKIYKKACCKGVSHGDNTSTFSRLRYLLFLMAGVKGFSSPKSQPTSHNTARPPFSRNTEILGGENVILVPVHQPLACH